MVISLAILKVNHIISNVIRVTAGYELCRLLRLRRDGVSPHTWWKSLRNCVKREVVKVTIANGFQSDSI